MFLTKKNIKKIKLFLIDPLKSRIALVAHVLSFFLIWYMNEYTSESVTRNYLLNK
jgi:hypothetical protein